MFTSINTVSCSATCPSNQPGQNEVQHQYIEIECTQYKDIGDPCINIKITSVLSENASGLDLRINFQFPLPSLHKKEKKK